MLEGKVNPCLKNYGENDDTCLDTGDVYLLRTDETARFILSKDGVIPSVVKQIGPLNVLNTVTLRFLRRELTLIRNEDGSAPAIFNDIVPEGINQDQERNCLYCGEEVVRRYVRIPRWTGKYDNQQEVAPYEWTCAHVACLKEKEEIMRKDETMDRLKLMCCADKWDFQTCQEIFRQMRISLDNLHPGTKKTALMHSALRSDAERLEFLMRVGADPNVTNDKGLTALW